MERVDSLKQRQKDLVKGGKKPFFLKNSAKKDIIAEERYFSVVMSIAGCFPTFFFRLC